MHTPVSASALALVIACLLLVSCAPTPVSLAGSDLVATLERSDDGERTTLAVELVGLGAEPGDCPTMARDAITFAGRTLDDSEVTAGGPSSDGGCSPLGLNVLVEARDPPEDGELVIVSGGDTVRWAAHNLLAKRRFLRAGDPNDRVPRGSIVRVNHEPLTDLLEVPEAVTLTDDAELELSFRLDPDGIVIDIPLAATPGPQSLDVTVPVEVPLLACEGFRSCVLKSSHFQQIPITIAP